ncbi:Hypothetical protein SMAX5B_018832, partial [Scophthalmus maximus]
QWPTGQTPCLARPGRREGSIVVCHQLSTLARHAVSHFGGPSIRSACACAP